MAGLTIILNVSGIPIQPPRLAVTDIFETTGFSVLFIAAKEGIFPVPLAAKPIEVLSLVQL